MAGHHIDKALLKSLDHASREAQVALRQATSRLPKLADVLRQMPGVKPRKARGYLNTLRDQMLSEILDHPDGLESNDVAYLKLMPGVVLTPANLDDLFFDESFGAARLTPRGVAILLKLYDAALLPVDRKLAGGGDVPALRQFAESEAALRAESAKDAEARAAAIEARQRLIADPASVREAQFDYGLLNDIFIARFGLARGSKTMEIGGIAVTKEARIYTSNSGIGRDSAVTFSWTGSDGQPHVLEKASFYASNRRNDPERNYGLPE